MFSILFITSLHPTYGTTFNLWEMSDVLTKGNCVYLNFSVFVVNGFLRLS
jgi:hypothetical protein